MGTTSDYRDWYFGFNEDTFGDHVETFGDLQYVIYVCTENEVIQVTEDTFKVFNIIRNDIIDIQEDITKDMTWFFEESLGIADAQTRKLSITHNDVIAVVERFLRPMAGVLDDITITAGVDSLLDILDYVDSKTEFGYSAPRAFTSGLYQNNKFKTIIVLPNDPNIRTGIKEAIVEVVMDKIYDHGVVDGGGLGVTSPVSEFWTTDFSENPVLTITTYGNITAYSIYHIDYVNKIFSIRLYDSTGAEIIVANPANFFTWTAQGV